MNPITDELIALAKKGELLSREFVRRKIKAVKKREEAAQAEAKRKQEASQRANTVKRKAQSRREQTSPITIRQ